MTEAVTEEIDREAAKARVMRCAFTTHEGSCGRCGHTCGEERRIVHSFLGSIGADWDAEDVCDLIDRASKVEWVDSLLDHDLSVTAPDPLSGGEKRYQFEVPAPPDSPF